MIKSVYIASRYGRRQEMLVYAKRLREVGVEVTSRWVEGLHDGLPDAVCAYDDLRDIDKAEALVSFTETPGDIPGRSRGGRHVEFGYALAKGKELHIVGPRENVFHHLLRCYRWPNFESFLATAHRMTHRDGC